MVYGILGLASISECLFEPLETPPGVTTYIIFLLLLQFLVVCFESYALRLRRGIAAFYYRKVNACRVSPCINIFCHVLR